MHRGKIPCMIVDELFQLQRRALLGNLLLKYGTACWGKTIDIGLECKAIQSAKELLEHLLVFRAARGHQTGKCKQSIEIAVYVRRDRSSHDLLPVLFPKDIVMYGG
jgi:hypothetical protein